MGSINRVPTCPRHSHLCRVADNTVWSHWQVASRSSEVNFTNNYTLLFFLPVLCSTALWPYLNLWHFGYPSFRYVVFLCCSITTKSEDVRRFICQFVGYDAFSDCVSRPDDLKTLPRVTLGVDNMCAKFKLPRHFIVIYKRNTIHILPRYLNQYCAWHLLGLTYTSSLDIFKL